jgi:hypothetical protein
LEEKRLITLGRKNKVFITAITAVAIILAVSLPFVSALPTSTNAISNTKTLKAQGFAYQKTDGQTMKYQANFTLTLQPTSSNGAIRKFDVAGGTVVVNGVPCAITGGNGGVLTGRRLILLQAQGTSPDGQSITLKLAGRYFWMGGHLYVARIGAKLQTDNANYTLLMRAAIRL